MAISVVQQDQESGTSSPASLSFPSAPTAGNLLVVVIVSVVGSNITVTTPGGGWVAQRTENRAVCLTKVSDGTEQTQQFAYSGGASIRIAYAELSGADTSSPIDTSGYAAEAAGTSDSLVTDANMSVNGCYALGISGQTGTNGSGDAATNSFTTLSGGTNREVAASRLYAAGTGSGSTANTVLSWNTSRVSQWMIVAIKPATSVALVIADAAHGHTADNLGLTQHHVLAVADATHGHAADNLALTQHNVLAIQDATHAHSADNIALTQHNVLAVADALHDHAADNLDLTAHDPGGPVALVIADGAHAHTADGDLVLGVGLAIQDATHGHSADNLVLTQHNILAIDDALHEHTAENCNVNIPQVAGPEQHVVRFRHRRRVFGKT